MNKKLYFNDILIPLLVLFSAVLLVVAVASPRSVGDTRDTARKVERRLERRMRQLDSYAARPDAKLPQDMVIYVYSDDTLRSWRGRFPILNDQISGALMVQRIVTPRANFDSPLSYVGPDPVLLNLGPSWYLVKAFEDSGTRTVAGLLVANSLETGAWGGVNPKLHIGAHFSVKPLTFSEGSAVYLDKRPVFKILYDSPTPAVTADAGLLWTALVLFLLASVLFVFRKRTLRRALIGCGCTLASTLAMYIWGHTVQTEFQIFSPMLYAGGAFLYSLGAMLLVNIAILLCTVDIYLARNEIWAKIKWPLPGGILAAADILAVVLIIAHAHSALRSVILNSNIALELYKLGGLSGYTGLIYASLLSMLTSVPMLLQMLQPVSTRLTGGRLDLFSKPLRFILAGIVAVWFVSASAVLGFQKESNRMEVWAGRLAVDRDINLELQLLRAEHRITEDGVISSLTTAEGTETIIRNRIVDNYLLAASQSCAISVQMLRPGSPQQVVERFRRILREGTPISEGSCFYCTPTSDGPSRYDGIFRYASSDAMIYLIVGVEQKNGVVGKGYERILSLSSGTRSTIPSFYSYSRYREGDLVTFKGSYPYSTKMDDWLKVMVYNDKVSHYNRDGYVHFVNTVSDDEAVIISRRSFTFFSYIVSGIFIALMMYLLLGALQPWKKRKAPEPNSLRSRISLTLMVSLILSLVVMASVSVIFVYGRNEANRNAIMSDRINAIQLLTQNGLRTMAGEDILLSSEFAGLIQSVSDNTGSDISVYSTDGRILLSTNPEVLDHLILGYRIEAEALDQIVVGKKRYCILKQGTGLRHYYNMYMPVLGQDGRPMAILCAPYVEEGYDFERDAAMHLMSIISVFLLLFIIASVAESAVLDRVFQPLKLLGIRMRRTGLDSMKHISYSGNDEISTLVDAYNRMVDQLSENSVQLAEAERNKAWSEMARQVAHEIKNPLTPMQLQIQSLIRRKQRGDDSWQDKFDEASKVLLDHIAVLTQTSNEFSTFARLYTEEHTEIDLDALLEEEISMFDNRDDIDFSYIGLQGARIKGPKPQLTRVFINLLTNAVQAVEGQEDAKIYVALRKSSREGYYDIVVEDNGPGVPEENLSKLFSPNFTTKNGGSGLGLAICKSVLQNCGATISYSRSFTLGGACFTIVYPED